MPTTLTPTSVEPATAPTSVTTPTVSAIDLLSGLGGTSMSGPSAYRSVGGPAVSRYVGAVEEEADRFVAAAGAGPLGTRVAACPGWTMRDLVEHLGLVHLWAAANIAAPSTNWLSVDEMADLEPYWPELTADRPDDGALLDWYRRTVATLVDVLDSTPADHRCLTFLPAPSPVEMWARRQAFELAMHRYDAEAARRRPSHFAASFAADMLDELLVGFAPRMRTPDGSRDVVMMVDADDADARFTVALGPDGVRTSSESSTGTESDLLLTGSAADLCILLWNRPAGPTIRCRGDVDVLELWRRTCAIRWL